MLILQTNDLHGKLTPELAERIAPFRQGADFYFDCGDCVATGNVGIPLKPEPVWELLHGLKCDASVPGNREFHVTEGGFRAKLAGSKHPILAANLQWKGKPSLPLQSAVSSLQSPLRSHVVIGDVGVFGIMVSMVTDKMAAKHLSAFINTSPIDAAKKCVEELRGKVRTLVALTHVGLSRDRELAEQVPGIDIILGGHSHDILEEPIRIGDTWICQAGSHGRFVGLHRYENGQLSTELISLTA